MLIKKQDSLAKLQSMFECQELCVTYKHGIMHTMYESKV
jgi:hypothetical protein